MIELSDCRQIWHEPLAAEDRVGEEEIMTLIQTRMSDVKSGVLWRVRYEIYSYLIIFVISLAGSILRHGLAKTLLATACLSGLYGLLAGALAYKERQLRTLPMAGSLRDSLTALIAALDSTTRLYMAAYMMVIVVPVVGVEAYLLWRYDVSPTFLGALLIGIGFVSWCYWSGRGYLQRAFGAHRAELITCLGELDQA